jgi:AcrR family transcriptional regulator
VNTTSLPAPSNTRADPRIVRSETSIRQALLDCLAAGREFNTLTVSEIASDAGVTRKTFYARFGSLEQVVDRMVADVFADIAAQIDDEMLRLPLKDNSLAMLVFKACEENQTVLSSLVRQCPAGLFLEPASVVASSLLDRAIRVNNVSPMPDVNREYLVMTVTTMIHGVLTVWIKRGFSESTEQVASFIDTLLAEGLQKIVAGNNEFTMAQEK